VTGIAANACFFDTRKYICVTGNTEKSGIVRRNARPVVNKTLYNNRFYFQHNYRSIIENARFVFGQSEKSIHRIIYVYYIDNQWVAKTGYLAADKNCSCVYEAVIRIKYYLSPIEWTRLSVLAFENPLAKERNRSKNPTAEYTRSTKHPVVRRATVEPRVSSIFPTT